MNSTHTCPQCGTLLPARTQQPEPIPRRHGRALHDLAFSPEGRRLRASGPVSRGVARLWDVEIGRELVTLAGEPGKLVHVGSSPDGNTLFAATGGGPSMLWCAPSWEEIEAIENKGRGP